jgi:transposase
MRKAPQIVLTEDEQSTLERWFRAKTSQVRLAQRARIVLEAARGRMNKDIATDVGAVEHVVGKWRRRFAQGRCAAIAQDAPRMGRPPRQRERMGRRIVEMTIQQRPVGATHWTVRTLATALGVNRELVRRVWKDAGLKPHQVRTFKLSTDPQFAEKVIDVVGLYLDPPDHALVLCVDEKSQIQALDRTQPGLPMKPGRAGTRTHDYKRNGTSTLFAALNVADGKLIRRSMPRHRHQEWLKFLRAIDGETPADLDLHLILDNYQTHKHPKVKKWLARHKRFHLHFTPTSSSWLNLVERVFRDLTDKAIRRGSFRSVDDLNTAIAAYIDQRNSNPQPFNWTASAISILDKVARARAVFQNERH